MQNRLVFPADDGGRRPVEFVSYEREAQRVTLSFDLNALLTIGACAFVGAALVNLLDR